MAQAGMVGMEAACMAAVECTEGPTAWEVCTEEECMEAWAECTVEECTE